MPRVVKSKSAKPAPVAGKRRARKKRKSIREMSDAEYHDYALKHGLGARILTYDEVMARNKPPAPGQPTGLDWLREFMSPVWEYNRWLIKTGREPLGELDTSLREERDE